MKLQEASRKEVTRIAVGVLVCDILMIAALYLLSLVGVGSFSLSRVLLGTICGSIVAIVNFILLCLTVQTVAQETDKRKIKRRFQRSYNIRLLVQAAWVVVCFVAQPIHFLAGAAPILFPNVVIFYLQWRGKLFPDAPSASPTAPIPEEDEPEDHLGSFEV